MQLVTTFDFPSGSTKAFVLFFMRCCGVDDDVTDAECFWHRRSGGCLFFFFQLDKAHLESSLPTIFLLLLRRSVTNKTVKYVRFLTIFFSTFIVKYGVAAFDACLQQQEAG